MKKSKWMKWKIGVVGTLGLAFLFHQVKISAEFEQAFKDAANDKMIESSTIEDPVMQEFNAGVSQQGNASTNEINQSNETSDNRRSHTKTGRS